MPRANYAITAGELAWIKGEIADYDMVILQFELPMPVVEAVAQWAHDAGVPVMVNPAPAAPMSDQLLACATFLSPNEHEAALLAGHEIRVKGCINFDDVAAVARAFRDRGVENLIITMGGNGSVIAGEDGIHHTPCVKMPQVADPTGAGDSFVAAFCTALSAGLPRPQALAVSEIQLREIGQGGHSHPPVRQQQGPLADRRGQPEAGAGVHPLPAMLCEIAGEQGQQVLIEPLGPKYSNDINTLPEAARVINTATMPNLFAMADLRHFVWSGEPFDNVVKCRDIVKHIHVDFPLSWPERRYPKVGDGYNYRPFFDQLKDYDGTLTIEADIPSDWLAAGRDARELMDTCANA